MKPIADVGPYPELARLATDLAAGRSLRHLRQRIEQNIPDAEAPSITTISKVLRGQDVLPENLEIFALGLGADPAPLFAAMGRIYRQPSTDSDPLSQIGPTVDTSALRHIPFFPTGASADTERIRDGQVPPESAEEVLPVDLRAIRVHGDCMEPHYLDGDIVFVNETDQAAEGDVVIATVDMSAISCKLYRAASRSVKSAYLEPTNGEGKIDASRFRINGVVVGFYRPMKRR